MNARPSDFSLRQRMVEVHHGERLSEVTGFFITSADGCGFVCEEFRAAAELDWFLDRLESAKTTLLSQHAYVAVACPGDSPPR